MLYWVFDKNTYETIAITIDPKIAEMVAENCGHECEVKVTEK